MRITKIFAQGWWPIKGAILALRRLKGLSVRWPDAAYSVVISTRTQHEKVNRGILSTAKIVREKVIPAMQKGQWGHIAAIASRSLASAQQVAADFGLAKAYGSYEELLADPEIEAICNPLPAPASMCCAKNRLP